MSSLDQRLSSASSFNDSLPPQAINRAGNLSATNTPFQITIYYFYNLMLLATVFLKVHQNTILSRKRLYCDYRVIFLFSFHPCSGALARTHTSLTSDDSILYRSTKNLDIQILLYSTSVENRRSQLSRWYLGSGAL
jgi:hypothetical protein